MAGAPGDRAGAPAVRRLAGSESGGRVGQAVRAVPRNGSRRRWAVTRTVAFMSKYGSHVWAFIRVPWFSANRYLREVLKAPTDPL